MLNDSSIPGFYRLSIAERIDALGKLGVLSPAQVQRLKDGDQLLSLEHADRMIENVVATFNLPFAIAPNFLINARDYLVPMVVEEPSIVAGVSAAAKMARASGGFEVVQEESLLAGQIQLIEIDDLDRTNVVPGRASSGCLSLAVAAQSIFQGGFCDLPTQRDC